MQCMKTLITFLQSFRRLTDPEQEIIAAFFERRQYKLGAYLFSGRKICDELFFISSGIARIATVSEKGMDLTLYFINEKQFCSILQSFTAGTSTEDTIQACCATEAMVISKARLQQLYQQLPFMNELINQANQQRLLEKIRLKNRYAGQDSLSRYKIFLEEQPGIANRVSLKDIASYLNITPQSLSRIRKNLK